MKTIMIWDTLGESNLSFAVLDGDYDYLDGTYLNESDADSENVTELNEIQETVQFVEEWPYDATTGAYRVIRCGFVP